MLLLLLQRRRHRECFAVSVIYLFLRRSQAGDQYTTGSSYFTGDPAGMKGQRGRRGRGRSDDDTASQGSLGSVHSAVSLKQKQVIWMLPKVRKGERSFKCDVGVNSAAEAYVLHGRQRSLTACRFSEFIMNVLLFSSFSLTFLFFFTPSFLSSCHLPPLFAWSVTPALPCPPVTDSCSPSS